MHLYNCTNAFKRYVQMHLHVSVILQRLLNLKLCDYYVYRVSMVRCSFVIVSLLIMGHCGDANTSKHTITNN